MPTVSVYLPDELHVAMEERGLSPSSLLQAAIRSELRRRRLDDEADRYLEGLCREVGEPSARQRAHASAIARRIRGHQDAAGT